MSLVVMAADIPLPRKKASKGKKITASRQKKAIRSKKTTKNGATTSTKAAPIIASEVIVIDNKLQPSKDPVANQNAKRITNRRKKFGKMAKVVDALKGRRNSVYAAIGKNIYETGEYKQFMVAFTTLQLTTLATMEGKDRFMAPRDAKRLGSLFRFRGRRR